MPRRVCAYAPASIGNFAAGFDALGAALAPLDGELWGDVVTAEPGEEASLSVTGPFAHLLPADPGHNLAWLTLVLMVERLGKRGVTLPPLKLTLSKNLPVGSGLGSSASTVVATLTAVNAWLYEPLDARELLLLAGWAEAKTSGAVILDNVAPSLLGGMRLVTPQGEALALPWPPELRLVLASPELQVNTATARACLPSEIALASVVDYGRNLATFIHALHQGDEKLLSQVLRDPLAEPHRAHLVPGFRQAQRSAIDAGALGCSLSGAGPALFAVAREADAPRVGEALRAALASAGVAAETRLCGLDAEGARLLVEEHET